MVTKNENWIIEAGSVVIKKRDALGMALSPVERLIFCLWVADYGMRNAGDLETASDWYEAFQTEAYHLSSALGLVATQSAFSIATRERIF